MHTKEDIIKQLTQTINSLKIKRKDMEPVIDEYIALYETALSTPTEDNLKRVINRSRGYLETSSYWQQDFLTEMVKTEKMVKEFVKI